MTELLVWAMRSWLFDEAESAEFFDRLDATVAAAGSGSAYRCMGPPGKSLVVAMWLADRQEVAEAVFALGEESRIVEIPPHYVETLTMRSLRAFAAGLDRRDHFADGMALKTDGTVREGDDRSER